MNKLHEAIADVLAGELERRGSDWDEPPALYVLRLRNWGPEARKIPLRDEAWDTERTGLRITDILHGFAQRLATNSAVVKMYTDLLMGDVHGVAFRHEGWALPDLETLPDLERETAEMSAAAAGGHSHSIWQHPDRVEVRTFMAVDRAQITYHAVLRRGEARAERFIIYPNRINALDASGTVIESLDMILAALTGVTPRQRLWRW